jgi:hypothetical protein
MREKSRIATDYRIEAMPISLTDFTRVRQWVHKLLVRAFQGHHTKKADFTFGDDKVFWKLLTRGEAGALLCIHGTSKESACQVMAPDVGLAPHETRGYLHFCSATHSNTVDQMDQLIIGGAYLILNMEYVLNDYSVYRNEVNTITLKRADGQFERSLPNRYIRYALDRRGRNLRFPDYYNLQRWSPYLGGTHQNLSCNSFVKEITRPRQS